MNNPDLILKKIRLGVIILVLSLTTASLFAQNTDKYNFEKLSIKDGLSHSNVYTIIQDQSGYLWFGTQDGLNKYDGYKFNIYRHEIDNPNSLTTGNLSFNTGLPEFHYLNPDLNRITYKKRKGSVQARTQGEFDILKGSW